MGFLRQTVFGRRLQRLAKKSSSPTAKQKCKAKPQPKSVVGGGQNAARMRKEFAIMAGQGSHNSL
jgi:hypothetical protein